MPYLQSFVKDVGLPAPFNRMIPLVEFDRAKPIDRGASQYHLSEEEQESIRRAISSHHRSG